MNQAVNSVGQVFGKTFKVPVTLTVQAASESEVYDGVNEVLRPLEHDGEFITDYSIGTVTPGASHIEYLASLPLPDALWWFIENVNADTPLRTEMFFALRERMRKGS